MKNYLEIVENTLKGEPKTPYRNREQQVVTDTVGIFAAIFRHDMREGFPLLTTKKMPLRLVAVELEGFIKGITDKKWYQDRNCYIWDEWCNPTKVGKDMTKEEKLAAMKAENDLGPIYGYQWRHFDEDFGHEGIDSIDMWDYHNGIQKGYDQFAYIVQSLEKNPTDRRMVCSAWNPNQSPYMALPPCHFAWNIVVYNGKLNLIWHQRSCDLMLGVPFNIASYALLLKLLAKHAKLEDGELVGTLNDCHIYANQIDGAKEQLTRTPFSLPELVIPDNSERGFDIFKWDHTQLELKNYQSHDKLNFALEV